jgi:hypothetical protein
MEGELQDPPHEQELQLRQPPQLLLHSLMAGELQEVPH